MPGIFQHSLYQLLIKTTGNAFINEMNCKKMLLSIVVYSLFFYFLHFTLKLSKSSSETVEILQKCINLKEQYCYGYLHNFYSFCNTSCSNGLLIHSLWELIPLSIPIFLLILLKFFNKIY